MRYVAWWTAGISVLLMGGCGGSGSDDGGGARSGSAGTGRGVGSGGGGPGTASRAFGNPPATPAGTGMPVEKTDTDTCASSDITATRVVPTVMLLLDGSSSMQACYGPAEGSTTACPADDMGGGFGQAPPAGTLSRWDAIRKAVVDPAVGVVSMLQDRVNFGVAVFGTAPTCPLPLGVIAPALNNFDAIAANVPVMMPGMFTPTGVALDQIVDMLQDPADQLDMTIGPQIVVLATDGDPNSCDAAQGFPMTDYAPSIAAAMKLQAKNQKMYVISVGQDAAMTHLHEMANIGAGLPQAEQPGATVYYPEDPAALAMTLETLIGQELSCDLALSGPGVVAMLACTGTVKLNGQPLECNGANGWALKDSLHITLNGTACDTFKKGSDAVLQARFPCEAQIVD